MLPSTLIDPAKSFEAYGVCRAYDTLDQLYERTSTKGPNDSAESESEAILQPGNHQCQATKTPGALAVRL